MVSTYLFWSLNVAIVNGWILYKSRCQQIGTPVSEQSGLLRFTITVSQSLLMQNKPPSNFSTLQRRGRPSRSEVPMSSQSYLADPQDEETGDMPMKKSRRTLLVNDASRFDFVGHLPVHCEPKQRCKLCGCYVRLKCLKCNCYLCVTKNRNCFVTFHTKE